MEIEKLSEKNVENMNKKLSDKKDPKSLNLYTWWVPVKNISAGRFLDDFHVRTYVLGELYFHIFDIFFAQFFNLPYFPFFYK